MVKTIVSIFISFAIIFGLSFYEVCYVRSVFSQFHDVLNTLYQKTESYTATYEDGSTRHGYIQNNTFYADDK